MLGIAKLAALKEDVNLYPHQERAVNNPNQSVVIAHSVGAGKTLTGIARFERLKEEGKASKALVVVPSSLRHNFAEQGVNRFTDSKAQIIGNKQEVRKGTAGDVNPDADYNIISYEMFRRDPKGYMQRSGADTIIADEFHKNKNEGTLTTDSLKEIRGDYKNFIGLTGSVISNSLADVQPLVDIASSGEHRLGENKKEFADKYLKRSNSRKYADLRENRRPIVGFKNKKVLEKELSKYVDYLDYQDVKTIANMPEKKTMETRIPLPKEEAKMYRRFIKNDPKLNKLVTNRRLETMKDEEVASAFNSMIEARKMMNSVATFTPGMSLVESAENTTKTKRLLDNIENHLKETPDGQVVVLSHLINGGHDVVSEGLKGRGIEHGLFLGKGNKDISEESRQADVRDFNDRKKRVILVSSAGGEGLSLNDTTYEAVLDGHYNPEKMNQMEARGVRSGGLSHRPQEEREVLVERHIATMPRTLGIFKSRIQTPNEVIYDIADNKNKNNQLLFDLLKSNREE